MVERGGGGGSVIAAFFLAHNYLSEQFGNYVEYGSSEMLLVALEDSRHNENVNWPSWKTRSTFSP